MRTRIRRVSLRIQLLGEFRVEVDGEAVPQSAWKRRSARQLVKLLALAPRYRLHREQVMDALWPDADIQSAANRLHKAVHMARRALEPRLALRGSSRFIHRGDDMLSLSGDGELVVDAVAFERLALEAIRTGDLTAGDAALAWYRGSLLGDDLYDEWIDTRREALRALYVKLLAGMAERAVAAGDVERAIGCYEAITVSDPADEEAHLALIELNEALGKRHTALRQYESCRSAMKRELDAEPDSRTRKAYQRVVAAPRPQIVALGLTTPGVARVVAMPSTPTRPRIPSFGMRAAAALCCVFLCAALAVQIVGATPKAQHKIRRFLARTTASFERGGAAPARLVSLKGRLGVPGVRVDSVDSVSGWASVTNESGAFSLLDVEASPTGRYDLVVFLEDGPRQVSVQTDGPVGDDGTIELADVDVGTGRSVDAGDFYGINSISYLTADELEFVYLEGVFDAVTVGRTGDEDRLAALNAFVASRYSTIWAPGTDVTTRETLDRGSSQSGALSRLMAAMCRAGGYDVRVVDIVDTREDRTPHQLVEVFYAGDWHAYDPSYGVYVCDESGDVASLAELRQRPQLIPAGLFESISRPGWDSSRIHELIASGARHDYYFTSAHAYPAHLTS